MLSTSVLMVLNPRNTLRASIEDSETVLVLIGSRSFVFYGILAEAEVGMREEEKIAINSDAAPLSVRTKE